MKISIPDDVVTILNVIDNAGFEAYIVGGCVRDFLLGKQPNDWDITTSAHPHDIKKLFNRTIDTGIVHGTVTVMMHGTGYEVTTYRIDGEYEDSRHPKEVTFTPNLKEDLRRRDFTINAMAYHPQKGLIDIFGGREDLDNKIIRAVGNPIERFSEDALRMMRAIRFAASLGYSIEQGTYEAIKELAPTISKISAERIQVEMVKLLVSDNPDMFRMFYETGLTKYFMPEFDEAMNTEQNHPHHCYSVGEHLLHSLQYIEPKKELRLSMLLHDIAKPKMLQTDEEGITHFHGHPKESGIMSKHILKRLKFDNNTIDKVFILSSYHDRDISPQSKAIRKMLNIIGEDNFKDLLKVKYADVMAQSMYLREEKLQAISELETGLNEVLKNKDPFSVKDLAVSGNDLISEGIPAGKEIGNTLNKMLEDVIDEPAHNNKEYLISTYVKNVVVEALTLFLIIMLCISQTACGIEDNSSNEDNKGTGFVPATPGNYDSIDKAVIVDINEENSTLQFQTTYDGRKYTLNFDGATVFSDKYGQGITLWQLRVGDYVETSFMKDRKRLDSLKMIEDEFVFEDVDEFEISNSGRNITIGNDKYTFDKNVVVVCQNGLGSLMDINAVDKITVIGKEHDVYSVIIKQGHGYLRLENDSYFIGGWIEVNKDIISKINSDMVMAVPVGTYDVTVSNQGSGGTEKVTINENEEYVLDVGKWKKEAKFGKVLFTVVPEEAKLYIDGNVTDITKDVELEYGIHQLIVIADGYQTISKYIKVGSESSNINIDMEKKDGADNSVSENDIDDNTGNTENTVSDNSNLPTLSSNDVYPKPSPGTDNNKKNSDSNDNKKDIISTTGEYRVMIDSPENVEVYVDGNYVGISPISFPKKEGQVVVTLRKDGYQTRSYTLSIDNGNKDVNYSFSSLVPIS